MPAYEKPPALPGDIYFCIVRGTGAGAFARIGKNFYKYGLRKTVELACESGYNEFIPWGVMPCLGRMVRRKDEKGGAAWKTG